MLVRLQPNVFIAVDRFLALCIPLRYNDFVTNNRTIVSSAVGKMLLLLITLLVFLLDKEVQDCDKVSLTTFDMKYDQFSSTFRSAGPCVS